MSSCCNTRIVHVTGSGSVNTTNLGSSLQYNNTSGQLDLLNSSSGVISSVTLPTSSTPAPEFTSNATTTSIFDPSDNDTAINLIESGGTGGDAIEFVVDGSTIMSIQNGKIDFNGALLDPPSGLQLETQSVVPALASVPLNTLWMNNTDNDKLYRGTINLESYVSTDANNAISEGSDGKAFISNTTLSPVEVEAFDIGGNPTTFDPTSATDNPNNAIVLNLYNSGVVNETIQNIDGGSVTLGPSETTQVSLIDSTWYVTSGTAAATSSSWSTGTITTNTNFTAADRTSYTYASAGNTTNEIDITAINIGDEFEIIIHPQDTVGNATLSVASGGTILSEPEGGTNGSNANILALQGDIIRFRKTNTTVLTITNRYPDIGSGASGIDDVLSVTQQLTTNRSVTLNSNTLSISGTLESTVFRDNGEVDAAKYSFKDNGVIPITATAVDPDTNYQMDGIIFDATSTGNITFNAPSSYQVQDIRYLYLNNTDIVSRTVDFNSAYKNFDGATNLGAIELSAGEQRLLSFFNNGNSTNLTLVADSNGFSDGDTYPAASILPQTGTETASNSNSGTFWLKTDDTTSNAISFTSTDLEGIWYLKTAVGLTDTRLTVGSNYNKTVYNPDGTQDFTLPSGTTHSIPLDNPNQIYRISVVGTEFTAFPMREVASGSSLYTESFLVGDWNDNTTDFSLTITAANHGKGTDPVSVQVFEDDGSKTFEVNLEEVSKDNTSGDITLKVDPFSGAFDGYITIN